jgi:hypothetical protein
MSRTHKSSFNITIGSKLPYTNSAGQYIEDEWEIDIGDDIKLLLPFQIRPNCR